MSALNLTLGIGLGGIIALLGAILAHLSNLANSVEVAIHQLARIANALEKED